MYLYRDIIYIYTVVSCLYLAYLALYIYIYTAMYIYGYIDIKIDVYIYIYVHHYPTTCVNTWLMMDIIR